MFYVLFFFRFANKVKFLLGKIYLTSQDLTSADLFFRTTIDA